MNWTSFVTGLGDLIFKSFDILKELKWINEFYIIIIPIILAAWVFMQMKYNKEAKQNGTLM